MNDLGTALRELAREAEPVHVDSLELWTRGRRRARGRRAAGAAAVAAVVLAVLALGSAFPTSVATMPAGRPHAGALPRNIYDPPSWYPGTASKGPLGRLAVLGVAMRHGQLALYGISATTGQYRFLDLQEATVTGASLSPDGRHVAYWGTGAPSGTPYPTDGQKVVSEVVVYDTEDGSAHDLGPFTEHGLGVSEQPIVWLDNRTILFSYGQKQTLSATTGIDTYTWTPPSAAMVPHTALGRSGTLDAATPNRDGSFQVRQNGRGWVRYDHLLRDLGGSVRPPAGGNVSAVSQSAGLRVFVGYTGSAQDDGLYVARGSASTAWTRVPGLNVAKLLGWTSENSVLVTGWSGSLSPTPSLYEVNLITSKVHRLGAAGGTVDSVAGVATELLGAPMVEGRDPRGPEPRVVLLAGGGVLAGAGLGLWLWRRRRAQG